MIKGEKELECWNCGAPLPYNAKFCEKCGEKIVGNGHTYISESYAPPPTVQITNMNVPPQGEHVTTGGWFGRIILSCIPVVGFIMLLVWAFGSTPQKSLKTWARAQLIFLLIPFAVFLFYVMLFAIGGTSLMHSI